MGLATLALLCYRLLFCSNRELSLMSTRVDFSRSCLLAFVICHLPVWS